MCQRVNTCCSSALCIITISTYQGVDAAEDIPEDVPEDVEEEVKERSASSVVLWFLLSFIRFLLLFAFLCSYRHISL